MNAAALSPLATDIDRRGCLGYNRRQKGILIMWDVSKSRRFQGLRSRELDGDLTEAEQTELAGLIRELEDLEAARLAPALERLRQENVGLELEAARLAQQERALAELLRQKEAYLARARAMVAELESERVDLLARFAEIVGEPLRDAGATSASAG